MPHYQKKPVPVEAFCYHGNFELDWLPTGGDVCKYGPEPGRIKIRNGLLGGAEWMADLGDWIVREGTRIYVVKPDEFQRYYEPLLPAPPANRAGCERCGGTGTRRAGDVLVHCECSYTTTNTGSAEAVSDE
jgi:hypothetical protein